MITADTIQQAIKGMGLNPEMDERGKFVSVLYEMSNMICVYDEKQETISIYDVNRNNLTEEQQRIELKRCHQLNEITNIGKCFTDEDGDQILTYQAKIFREEDLPKVLKEGLECLASMIGMLIRMHISDF